MRLGTTRQTATRECAGVARRSGLERAAAVHCCVGMCAGTCQAAGPAVCMRAAGSCAASSLLSASCQQAPPSPPPPPAAPAACALSYPGDWISRELDEPGMRELLQDMAAPSGGDGMAAGA